MRKKIVTVGFILATLLVLVNFKSKEAPVQLTQNNYVQEVEQFYTYTQELYALAKTYHAEKNNREALQNQLIATRLQFKKIEFLLDYLQPQDVKDYLNGAPLPKTERNAPRLVVMEPKGLQVLEELIFGAELELQSQALVDLTKDLQTNSQSIWQFQKHLILQDRHILEAARLGVVRIMALGLTGFDTPMGANTMAENRVAFQSIHQALKPYLQISAGEPLAQELNSLFKKGEQYLAQHQNFQTFNRALFIREFLDPMYKKIGALHQYLGVETMDEVVEGENALQYQAQSMFGADFLNPYFYTSLYHEMDNPALQKLGQHLFFDPILSANLKRSCASCHNPNLAFTDGYPTSLSLKEGQNITRNAPTLVNAIFSEKFFYDLRADKMDSQMEHVIFNAHEFGTNYQTIFSRLEQSSEYRELFKQAFPEKTTAEINRYTLSAALSSYVLSLQGFNSPVDRYLRGEAVTLDQEVLDGFNLFMGKAACGTCHFAPTFAGLVPPYFEENETEVLGVLTQPNSDTLDPDLGRYASGRPADRVDFYKHSFKTVTVRNVSLTAPYFHNGAYTTLEQVMDFYNHGGAQGLGLDLPQQTLPGDSLNLNPGEEEALIAFMEALTDTSGLTQKPSKLPVFEQKPEWNKRMIGGEY